MKAPRAIAFLAAVLVQASVMSQDVFSLQFQGPEDLRAKEGVVVPASYGVLLVAHSGFQPGAQAWSFGVTSSASTVTGATTEGTAADLVENGGLRRGGFEKTETIDPGRNGGRSGAVSAVVLSFMDGVRLTSMFTRIATFDVDFPIPAGSGLATITFDGSLRGSGLPVKLAVTQEGETKVPRVQSRVVRLTAVPPNPDCCAAPLNLGFSTRLLRGMPPFEGVEGTGPLCHGGDEVIDHAVAGGPQKVFVNIVTDLDAKSGGVEAWSLSIAVDGGGDMLSATTAGTAADREENGGLFFGGFNKTQLVDPARNGGRDGAISACVLSFALGTTLPLRGTESVLALEVSGPEGATSLLSAAHPLRGALPIPTVLTVRGASRLTCNLEEASLRIRHVLSRSFIRGDANGDLRLDIADPVWTLSALYLDGPPAVCADAADSNDDGLVDASDVVGVIEYLFKAGGPPSSPFPECGADVTEDDLGCLGSSPACQ